MSRVLIGIVGQAGAGKSTLARLLVEQHGFCECSLAEPIKAVCAAIFDFTPEQLFGPSEMRNAPDPRWDGLTPRRALQVIGTDIARALHPDVWVRTLLRTLRQPGAPWRAVVSDVRFQNELDALAAEGAHIIRITRNGLTPLDHATEQTGSLTGVHWTIANDGTVDELAQLLSAGMPGHWT